MIHNAYDHALKILARNYPDQFLRLGFPNQVIQPIGTQSNVELALEIERVDFLHEAILEGIRVFYHMDFQLEHEADSARRFFIYNGILTALKEPTPVLTLPVYLRRREAPLPDFYEVKIGQTVFHRFTYKPIKMWDYVDQIRSGQLHIFAPLLPLLVKSTDEQLLIEEREIILKHEPDSARQNTLLTTAILIATQSKLFNRDFLWDLFKEDKMDFNDPVMAKLLEKAYGERLQQQVAIETQKQVAIETQRFEQRLKEFEWVIQRMTESEASARREAEAARRAEEAARRAEEAARHAAAEEGTRRWQELMLKMLEHRFKSVPVALILLLQEVSPSLQSQVSDLFLDAPTIEACWQGLQQLTKKV